MIGMTMIRIAQIILVIAGVGAIVYGIVQMFKEHAYLAASLSLFVIFCFVGIILAMFGI